MSKNVKTVAESLVTINSVDDTLDCQRLADMMHMPISHYLGPIGYAMSHDFGFSHPPITWGMLIAQAVREALSYERHEIGMSEAEPTSFQIVGVVTNYDADKHHN